MLHISSGRNQGNALIVTVIAFTLLAGLSMAQTTFFVKNQQQATFFESQSELRRAAESGLALAIHDFKNNVGDAGFIGTTEWTENGDFGADGYPSTLDDGESDGLPTDGEPGVVPVRIGSDRLDLTLYTTVVDTSFAGVQRVLATAVSDGERITVEKLVQTTDAFTVPEVGSLVVDPSVALDFSGNAFFISGNDTNPDGSDGDGDDLPALMTEADPDDSGENLAALLSQVNERNYDQLEGAGGYPSVGETTEADVNDLADTLFAFATPLDSDTYRGADLGSWESQDFKFLGVEGDLTLAGTTTGAGILVVDGSLDISGDFQYHGLIVVRGDLRFTGGGSEVQVYGAIMVTDSFSAVDRGESDTAEITVNGTVDLYYSSQVVEAVQNAFQTAATVDTVYYKED